jgi:hypothetical protein
LARSSNVAAGVSQRCRLEPISPNMGLPGLPQDTSNNRTREKPITFRLLPATLMGTGRCLPR